jgi:hypothetical protein
MPHPEGVYVLLWRSVGEGVAMGKCKDPKVILIDSCFLGAREADELAEKGHTLEWYDLDGYDLIISPKAQMTPPGRLAYVVKKLKEIVKEVKGA